MTIPTAKQIPSVFRLAPSSFCFTLAAACADRAPRYSALALDETHRSKKGGLYLLKLLYFSETFKRFPEEKK